MARPCRWPTRHPARQQSTANKRKVKPTKPAGCRTAVQWPKTVMSSKSGPLSDRLTTLLYSGILLGAARYCSPTSSKEAKPRQASPAST